MLTNEGKKRSRLIPRDTVVIANSGYSLGVAKLLTIDSCANDGIAALSCLNNDINPKYVVYYINYITEYLREIVAIGNDQPNLNTDRISKIAIPIPNNAEQRHIVQALGDADALICALEALIAKKRDVKQGAMEDLLRGLRRLPGFTGDWSNIKLGHEVGIRNEKVQTRGYLAAKVCIELEQISSGTGSVLYLTEADGRNSVKCRFYAGDVLFGRLRPYLRKYWHADREGVCSTEIWPLVSLRGQVDHRYLFYVVQSEKFIEAASAAYGTHMPRADWKMLADFVLALPPRLEEQRAIAAVLSDMDDEITALEARLAKARDVKQGMMRALLTGEVRIV